MTSMQKRTLISIVVVALAAALWLLLPKWITSGFHLNK